jgi:hypothetical protein
MDNFTLASAMQSANRYVFQKKNPKGQTTEIKIDPISGSPYDVKLVMLGEGNFSEAYLTKDNNVLILTSGEETKRMLSDIYAEQGELSYVPKVEYIGQGFTDDEDYQWDAFLSPLYKVPLNYYDSPKAYHMYLLLKEAIDKGHKANAFARHYGWEYEPKDIAYYSKATRKDTINLLKQSEPHKIGDVDSDLTLEEWTGFVDTVVFLIEKSFDYSDYWLLEASVNNLGLDANGQLILLDIFFDKYAETTNQGRY